MVCIFKMFIGIDIKLQPFFKTFKYLFNMAVEMLRVYFQILSINFWGKNWQSTHSDFLFHKIDNFVC